MAFQHFIVILICSVSQLSIAFNSVTFTHLSCHHGGLRHQLSSRINTARKPLVFEMSVIPPETSIKEDLPLKDGKLSGKVTSNAAEAPCLQSFGVEVAATGDKALISLWAARGILLLVAILWGTNFASVKYLETLCFHPPCNHPPSEAALARFGVAGVASIPFLVGQPTAIILAGLECGIWISLGYFTQALALSSISASKAAFICSLTVVVVPIVSYLLYKKPVTATNVLSAVIALSGVAVLEGMVDFHQILGFPAAITEPVASTPAVVETVRRISDAAPTAALGAFVSADESFFAAHKGDLLALGQPLGFGFAFMKIEEYVEKFKDVKNKVLTISSAQCVAVGILSLFWVLFDFHGHIPNFTYMLEPHRIGAILWTGIVTTVLAIYFEGIALQVASATEAALLFSSEPVWASIFSAWLLHERE